jgi:hypothetical protein
MICRHGEDYLQFFEPLTSYSIRNFGKENWYNFSLQLSLNLSIKSVRTIEKTYRRCGILSNFVDLVVRINNQKWERKIEKG